ncbi:TIR domain-containing protein [Reichenbachiella sp. MALMAid0571]|uniref:TIR domain-containing protein n=1 Tax=Reichenbachiella sp. MALMAid0571 TaxID=3143939 RepID=UPI0032E055ED
MQKSKEFIRVKFSPQKLKEAVRKWEEKLPSDRSRQEVNSRRIVFPDETWGYDNDEEFFADFQKEYNTAYYSQRCFGENSNFWSFSIESRTWQNTVIEVQAPTRAEIEDVFHVFEKDWANFKLPEPEVDEMSPVIFIGHGRSTQWRDLKDHLSDKHGYRIEAYETGARAGHTIRDILDEMLGRSTMALLVHTGEDELKDGEISARPNVIHETGLFQGKLGFSRALVLLEEGTSEFSNLYGIQQIRYTKNNIKETFGEVLATIKREFG